ncbi:GCN5-related N-acetyltransferase [Candidatus Vecturithrix granuli]|uniref:GCN5-related N-acetyltransferase n=1 Tax=Vecturithrix granuli TaxID=1499967 RepID=A0A081C837_VECG1|nr:GCN5-related N-acetyltransferase [Candidatus Vecturithrix granuli]
MRIEIREMTMADYDAMLALWKISEGIGLSNADSRDNMTSYLQRNPGLSFVAYDGDQLVGTVLCGHDGRRGYLHHLAVSTSHRHQGIGRKLANQALTMLQQQGIEKCHLFVIKNNREALAFWKRVGWKKRVDLVLMSKTIK